MSMPSHAIASRRTIVAAGGMLATAVIAGVAWAQPARRSTYVLVHPAWHGGWCWKKVTPLLQAKGHDVYTPTLTGLGERSHLAHPDVGLETHIQDILNVLKYEDLSDVILVGHSSSGVVITGVADRTPERIAHLVYLDAFVPENGQSMMDIVPRHIAPRHEARVQSEGQGWLLPKLRCRSMGYVCARRVGRDRRCRSSLDGGPPRPYPVQAFQRQGATHECGRPEAATHLHSLFAMAKSHVRPVR
jgi:pimeloyl-ACP methyl ester carboxylesterase